MLEIKIFSWKNIICWSISKIFSVKNKKSEYYLWAHKSSNKLQTLSVKKTNKNDYNVPMFNRNRLKELPIPKLNLSFIICFSRALYSTIATIPFSAQINMNIWNLQLNCKYTYFRGYWIFVNYSMWVLK